MLSRVILRQAPRQLQAAAASASRVNYAARMGRTGEFCCFASDDRVWTKYLTHTLLYPFSI